DRRWHADNAQPTAAARLLDPLHHELGPCAIQFRKLVRLKFHDDAAHSRAIHGNEIRVAVHEADVSAIRADLRHVACDQRTTATLAGCPMKHLKTSEMPTDANESEIVIQAMRLALPEHNRRILMLHPFAIRLVQVDRDAAECTAPLDHAGVVLRMENRNGGQAAECLHKLDGIAVNQAKAVPEKAAILRLQQECPLSDCKIRYRVNPPRFLAFIQEDVTMGSPQLVQRDPLLSVWPDVLAHILANRAVPRRFR